VITHLLHLLALILSVLEPCTTLTGLPATEAMPADMPAEHLTLRYDGIDGVALALEHGQLRHEVAVDGEEVQLMAGTNLGAKDLEAKDNNLPAALRLFC
jgi:hypothetical protein